MSKFLAEQTRSGGVRGGRGTNPRRPRWGAREHAAPAVACVQSAAVTLGRAHPGAARPSEKTYPRDDEKAPCGLAGR